MTLTTTIASAVYCPCCSHRAEAFLPFGLQPRANAMCPGCGSLERHRLMWKYFADETRLFQDRLRVLHVAPELRLRQDFERLENLAYFSLDLTSPLAALRADLTALPFPDRAFDVILCSHVLEHVPDDRAALREMHRILRPKGWALLQSPMNSALPATFEDPSVVDPLERERLFGQRDHVRIYGSDYAARLQAGGFRVEVSDYSHRLGEDGRRACAILPEDIYIGVRE